MNFLGRTGLEGIVVVTERSVENPSVRTSAFFLPVFFSSFAPQVQPAEAKEGEEVKRSGGRVCTLSPFWCSAFPGARRDLSGALRRVRCEKCLTWQGMKWQKQTHVVKQVLLIVFVM